MTTTSDGKETAARWAEAITFAFQAVRVLPAQSKDNDSQQRTWNESCIYRALSPNVAFVFVAFNHQCSPHPHP
jgi:hypothetical protein